MAAAVAILAGAGLVTRAVLLERPPTAALMAPWLSELSAEELHEVLDSMAFEAPVPRDLAVGLTDLTETQLRELLAQMEE